VVDEEEESEESDLGQVSVFFVVDVLSKLDC
jgi:hypothetical protein